MVKRCCYGTCKSDTRYPCRLTGGVKFIPFPKPKTNAEKCQRWIRLCGRPHEQLNMSILNEHKRAKHLYVCTKHFVDGKPTAENPDPLPPGIMSGGGRKKRRGSDLKLNSVQPNKKRKILMNEPFSSTKWTSITFKPPSDVNIGGNISSRNPRVSSSGLNVNQTSNCDAQIQGNQIQQKNKTMCCEFKMYSDKNFQSYIMDRMRKHNQFFDVEIVMRLPRKNKVVGIQTSIIEAHKCVLAASSHFFYNKLNQDHCSKVEFDLGKEFWKAEDLKAVVEFLYSGKIILNLENLLNITYLSKLLGLSVLETLCDKYVTLTLSWKTFLPLYITLISNKTAISVSEKMMVQRDKIGEFVQSAFFSQLLEDNLMIKLSSPEMLLLIRNIVFDGMQTEDLLPILKLAVLWPLTHKDTVSLKVSEEMIDMALRACLSKLNDFQRTEIQNSLQGAVDKARLRYGTCRAKVSQQFYSHICKSLALVVDNNDENELNKVKVEHECESPDQYPEDSNVIPIRLTQIDEWSNNADASENTEEGAITDSKDFVNVPNSVITSNIEKKSKHIQTEPLDDADVATEKTVNSYYDTSTVDAYTVLLNHELESEFEIKIEVDIDDSEYHQLSDEYSEIQTESSSDDWQNNANKKTASRITRQSTKNKTSSKAIRIKGKSRMKRSPEKLISGKCKTNSKTSSRANRNKLKSKMERSPEKLKSGKCKTNSKTSSKANRNKLKSKMKRSSEMLKSEIQKRSGTTDSDHSRYRMLNESSHSNEQDGTNDNIDKHHVSRNLSDVTEQCNYKFNVFNVKKSEIDKMSRDQNAPTLSCPEASDETVPTDEETLSCVSDSGMVDLEHDIVPIDGVKTECLDEEEYNQAKYYYYDETVPTDEETLSCVRDSGMVDLEHNIVTIDGVKTECLDEEEYIQPKYYDYVLEQEAQSIEVKSEVL